MKWLRGSEQQEKKPPEKWLHGSEQQKKKLPEKWLHEKKKELQEKGTIVNAWIDIKK